MRSNRRRSSDESIEELYEDIEEERELGTAFYTIITGDFNAKIRIKQLNDFEYVENFGIATRNDKGID